MEEFAVGDVVQHKSGGPKMVVLKLENNQVRTEWMQGSSKHVDWFLATSMTKNIDKPRPDLA